MASHKRKRSGTGDDTSQVKVRDEGFTVLADPDDANLEYVQCEFDIL